MNRLTTPEDRFANIPDYPFSANYIEVDSGLNMHYVDEGDKNAEVILMLHGEPTWSYLYRKMIPLCVQAGYRVIAPDLIGFGKSDKLMHINDYSYQSHLNWVLSLIEQLNLTGITLVGQDWGSLLGLRLAAEHDDRFARIVIANGALPTGELSFLKNTSLIAPFAFMAWRTFALYSPVFPTGKIISVGAQLGLNKAERAAYDAPFPDNSYMAAVRAFPKLVPILPNDPASAANIAAFDLLKQWHKPFMTCFSSGDPITRGIDTFLQNSIPGAKGMPHRRIPGGHFVQENSPVEFANAIIELIALMPR